MLNFFLCTMQVFCQLCVIVEKLESCMKCTTIQYPEYQNKKEGLSVKGQPTPFQNEGDPPSEQVWTGLVASTNKQVWSGPGGPYMGWGGLEQGMGDGGLDPRWGEKLRGEGAHVMGPAQTSPLWTDRQTENTENITFLQLRWRMVVI